MTSTQNVPRYHQDAYEFLRDAMEDLRYKLGKVDLDPGDPDAHISPKELLEGIREYALKNFGLLTLHVLDYWGIHSTEDFGYAVYELIDQGDFKRNKNDFLKDFFNGYDFKEAFETSYEIKVHQAFEQNQKSLD